MPKDLKKLGHVTTLIEKLGPADKLWLEAWLTDHLKEQEKQPVGEAQAS